MCNGKKQIPIKRHVSICDIESGMWRKGKPMRDIVPCPYCIDEKMKQFIDARINKSRREALEKCIARVQDWADEAWENHDEQLYAFAITIKKSLEMMDVTKSPQNINSKENNMPRMIEHLLEPPKVNGVLSHYSDCAANDGPYEPGKQCDCGWLLFHPREESFKQWMERTGKSMDDALETSLRQFKMMVDFL